MQFHNVHCSKIFLILHLTNIMLIEYKNLTCNGVRSFGTRFQDQVPELLEKNSLES